MIKFLINRPIGVSVIVVAIIILCIVAIFNIPTTFLPKLEVPEITVMADYNELDAEIFDKYITRIFIQKLNQTNKVKSINSQTTNGHTKISILFEPGTNMDYAFYEVNEKVDLALFEIPYRINRPDILKRVLSDIPLCYVSVNLNDTFAANEDVAQKFFELSQWTNEVFIPRLEQNEHIAFVDVTGLEKPFIEISINPQNIAKLQISNSDLASAIQQQDIKVTGLKFIKDNLYQTYGLRNEIQDINDIRNLYLSFHGHLYRLGDIANVKLVYEKQEGYTISNGRKSIILAVYKKYNSSLNRAETALENIIQSFKRQNPEINLTVSNNQSMMLTSLINNLFVSLLLGLIIVLIIVFFFYSDPKIIIIISLTVPISVLFTFLLLYIFNITLNIISLSGLIISLGLAIDNAIIVTDNITQKFQTDYYSFDDAISLGTNEIIAPMLSSSLTTCVVFLPLIFLSGMAGILFYDQAVAIVTSQIASFIVSITVIPVLFKIVFKNSRSPVANKTKDDILTLKRLYGQGIRWTFSHKLAIAIIIILMICGGILSFLNLEKESIPSLPEEDGLVTIDWNESISPELNNMRSNSLIKNLKNFPQYYEIYSGRQDFKYSEVFVGLSNKAYFYIKAKSPEALIRIKSEINQLIKEYYPLASVEFLKTDNPINRIFRERNTDNLVKIYSNNATNLDPDMIYKLIDEFESKNFYILKKPTTEYLYEIFPKHERMSAANIEFSDLQNSILQYFVPLKTSEIEFGSTNVPIYVKSGNKFDNHLFSEVFVKNEEGDEVPIEYLIEIKGKTQYSMIESDKAGPYVSFIIPATGKERTRLIKEINDYEKLHPDMKIKLEGSYFNNQNVIKELSYILIISFLLLYLILAAQFESLWMPLVVLFEIPIDFAFVLIVYFILGESLNIMALIGLIVISGIVINDSILKVDKIIHNQKDGYELLSAIHQGGEARLKAILITSLTTIGAVIPQMFGKDVASVLQFPFSLVLVLGLFIGIIVSLFLIPLLYYYVRILKK